MFPNLFNWDHCFRVRFRRFSISVSNSVTSKTSLTSPGNSKKTEPWTDSTFSLDTSYPFKEDGNITFPVCSTITLVLMVAVLYWASALESLVFQTNRNILFNILISVILRLEIIVKFFLWLFSCNLFYFCTICDQSTNPKLTCCKVSHQASKPSEREDGYSSLLQNLCQRQCFKSRPKVNTLLIPE